MRVSVRAAALTTALAAGMTAAATTGAAAAPASGGAAPASGGTVRLWAARYHGPNHFAQPGAIAVSPDGAKVFVTGSARTRRSGFVEATVAYDAASGTRLWAVTSNPGGGGAIAVSPDGSEVFVAGSVTVAYNAATGAIAWTKPFPGSAASRIAVSPDGADVFVTGLGSGNQDAATVAYSAANGATVWTQHAPSSTDPGGLVVSPDGSTVFMAGSGTNAASYQTVAYDVATGNSRWVRYYHGPFGSNSISAAVISPDGSRLVVTGLSVGAGTDYDTATVAYDTATGATRWIRVATGGAVAPSLTISPDGSSVFVAGGAFRAGDRLIVKVVGYNAATGTMLWRQTHGSPAGDNVAKSIAVGPDGSRVYVAGWNPRDYLTLAYDAATGAPAWQRDYPHGEGFAVAAGPDGSAVFVTGLGFPTTPGCDEVFATVAYRP
jgi:DNA-binding beta-propeller fold protein YncE